MTYERFLKVIISLQKEERTINALYTNGVDLINFVDPYHEIISELIKEIYGEEGYDWFSWFCNDSEFGQKDWSTSDSYKLNEEGNMEIEYKKGEVRFGACDKEGNPICYSFESLYEYLEENHKTK